MAEVLIVDDNLNACRPSASGGPDHMAKAKALGANDYLLKGAVDFDKLEQAVNIYVRPSV